MMNIQKKAVGLLGLMLALPLSAAAQNASLSVGLQPSANDGRFVVLLDDEGSWDNFNPAQQATWTVQSDITWNTQAYYFPGSTLAKVTHQLGKIGEQADLDVGDAWVLADEYQSDTPSVSHQVSLSGAQFLANYLPEGIMTDPVGKCNAKKQQLLSEGKSLNHILSRDWVVSAGPAPNYLWLVAQFDVDHQAMGGAYLSEQRSLNLPLEIVCKGNKAIADDIDPVGGMGLIANKNAKITGASIQYLPAIQSTQCPAQVIARITFTSATQGGVKAKVRSVWGQTSKTMNLEMTAADKKGAIYSKVVSEAFTVGDKQSNASAANNQLVAVTGSGWQADAFAAPQGPLDGGPTGLKNDGAADNVLQDSLWVDIIEAAPGSVGKSGYEAYKVTCVNAPTRTRFSTPGNLANPQSDAVLDQRHTPAAKTPPASTLPGPSNLAPTKPKPGPDAQVPSRPQTTNNNLKANESNEGATYFRQR